MPACGVCASAGGRSGFDSRRRAHRFARRKDRTSSVGTAPRIDGGRRKDGDCRDARCPHFAVRRSDTAHGKRFVGRTFGERRLDAGRGDPADGNGGELLTAGDETAALRKLNMVKYASIICLVVAMAVTI